MPLTVPTLQRIDRRLGVPVCLGLTLVRRLAAGGRPAGGAPRDILFVKFAEQGSTVLAHAAIRRAVEMVGRDHVHFVVFEENRFILDVLGLIPPENVITIPQDGAAALIRGAWDALREIRRRQIDAVIDLEFFSRCSAAFTFLTGAGRRVGFHTFFGEGPYRGDLMTHRLLYNPFWHTSQIFELMVIALKADPARLPALDVTPPPVGGELPRFQPRPEETAEIETLLDSFGAKDAPLILLNPNASDLMPLRRWEPARYVELARRLLAELPEIRIALTGAPNESAPIARLAAEAGSPRCFSLAGRTTLRQLMVLYTRSELLVTNDSGPAHFAALTSVDVITLFGPETPLLFAALTPRNTSITAGLACSPCVNAHNNRQTACTDNVCMQRITVERVLAEALRICRARRRS